MDDLTTLLPPESLQEQEEPPQPEPDAGAADDSPEPEPAVTIPTVDIAGVWDNPSPEPDFVWDGHIPRGHVCLLSGHGGSGKSTAALQIAVAVAMGLPLWGVPTTQGPVAFFSGEDAGPILRHRLADICQSMNINPHLLAQRLLVLDATSEPVLYQEIAEFGRRTLEPAPVFHRLAEILTERQPALCVIDNASDAFEANENDRAQVRGFVRALANLGRQGSRPAILLLTHTSKATVRGGGESYSGSTAWHNSARARLSLAPDKNDTSRVVLTLDKMNLAPMTAEPLRLARTMGGVLVLDSGNYSDGIEIGEPPEPPQTALLRILADFVRRDEKVSPAPNSPRTNAWALFRQESGFPKRAYPNAGALFSAMRDIERAGLIQKEVYRNQSRKDKTAWALTAEGWALIREVAPSAPSAPTPEVGTVDAVSAEISMALAPSAPTSGARGMGGGGAHEVGANLPDAPMAEKSTCPRCDGEGCEFCQPERASQ